MWGEVGGIWLAIEKNYFIQYQGIDTLELTNRLELKEEVILL